MTIASSIIDAFENYLIASRSTEESTKAKKFYVSDMGKCLRMRYLKRKGIKAEYGADTYYTFAHGDFIHNLGYKALEAKGLLDSLEQYVESEHFIGRYDGKLLFNNKITMFDIKSTNPYVLKRIVAGGSDNIENIMQVLAYLLLDPTKKTMTQSGVIVYVNKLPSDKIEPTIIHPREYHLEIYEKDIQADISKVIEYWLTNKIPPCTCPSWSIQKYNAFYLFCHMSEKDVQKHLDYLKAGRKVSSNGFTIFVKDMERKEA